MAEKRKLFSIRNEQEFGKREDIAEFMIEQQRDIFKKRRIQY